jgi:ABC-2 type transport system permease protein
LISFSQIYQILRREYLARVKNKAFIMTTIMVPMFMVGYLLFLPLLFSGSGPANIRIAIIDVATGLGDATAGALEKMGEPSFDIADIITASQAGEEFRKGYNQRVLDGELDGYIVMRVGDELKAEAVYYARETGNPVMTSGLQSEFRGVLLRDMLAGTDVDVDRIEKIQRARLETVSVTKKGEEEGGFELAFFSTIAFSMLLYMAVLINGQGMAVVLVEEKSSRLIEVVLGAVTALEFMAGKIAGVLFSGLTQLAVWVACALVGVLYMLPAFAASGSSMFNLEQVLNLEIIFYFSLFFILGYILYSTVFAALAVTCNSVEELSHALMPAILPFILAFLATFYAVMNPSSGATRVMSLFPPFTPLVMLARINVLPPPLWEIWLSILLLLFTIVLAVWITAKIFSFALLMYGKRITFPEIIKMVKQSR